jgi:hypothetical protein
MNSICSGQEEFFCAVGGVVFKYCIAKFHTSNKQ